MKYFAGLDISLKETAICIKEQDGHIICEAMVPTEPSDIMAYLKASELSFETIGLEAGNLSIWLHRALSEAGYPVICIETRKAKAAMAAQNVKTDRNDARGIADIMRTGWFTEVHVKSDEAQRLRMVLNNRKCLVEQRILLENQIRGTLKTFGGKTGKVTILTYEARIRDLISGDGELEAAIFPLLEVRTLILKQVTVLDKMLITAAKNDPVCELLMTVPSIGALTALLFKTVIDDPKRFKRSRDVAPHLGLTPSKYASGEIDYNGRITKCGDSMLRAYLYQSAMILMMQRTRKTPLKSWGLRIAKRSGKKKAAVAVARRLAIIMHRMWMDGTAFRWEEGDKIKVAA